jgi:hypothetical protein
MIGPRRGRRSLAAIAALAAGALLAGCGLFGDEPKILLRSDPPVNGMVIAGKYVIQPDGAAETNQIEIKGMNGASPMPIVTTTFERGASSISQTATVTSPNGGRIAALSMVKRDIKFGLTEVLRSQVATYEQRDQNGNRVCGARVRLTWQPLLAQQVLKDKYRRAWDALFYYSVPCTAEPASPAATLNLAGARFLGLVISQQFTPRIVFGRPSFFNRGHCVTVVGGKPARLGGSWWQTNAGILNASNLVLGLVKNLDQHEWLDLTDEYADSDLVYSAGDADVYVSWRRLFLNRQSDYLVHFRAKPEDPWQKILVHPEYNKEWNDFSQNWKALTGTQRPKLDDLVDKETGLPKNIDKPDEESYQQLKEIETAGCQNCPNVDLEQIQFVNPDTKQPLYAMTIRGYLGSQSSLVLFGRVPGSLQDLLGEAESRREGAGFTQCPIRRNEKGEKLADDEQYSSKDCARFLREGSLWDLLTQNPAKANADVVGQFQLRDNSSYASQCTGSGDSTVCETVVTSRRLDASYLFTDSGPKLRKAWTVLQLLGEVGMRTLGMSYASGAYDGSGLDFAMAQMLVPNAYYSDLASKENPYNNELVFGLDARALQLPTTLGEASANLYGSKN